MNMKFRRNTHDRAGNYKEEFRYDQLNHFQRMVWEKHGSILHLLFSRKAISYNDLLQEIRKDNTNYHYYSFDLQEWIEGAALPDPRDVALSLIRLIEAGFVEVCTE
jgi:hypothetical protein